MDVNLNVEITHLTYLNIDAKTSLTNQHIFALKESDEDNIEDCTFRSYPNRNKPRVFKCLDQITFYIITDSNRTAKTLAFHMASLNH